MTITQVRVVSIPVSDQSVAREFYVRHLGFEVLADIEVSSDVRWVQLGLPSAETSVSLMIGDSSMPAGSLSGLVLSTSDIDGDCTSMRAAGVAVEGPSDEPEGRRAVVRDPDGNAIILLRAGG